MRQIETTHAASSPCCYVGHGSSESVDVRRIGNELGVRYIAEGTMRQAGNELRIAVQLVDASSRVYLWAETFNRELQKAAPVELRNEITDRTLPQLPTSMVCSHVPSPRPRTPNRPNR